MTDENKKQLQQAEWIKEYVLTNEQQRKLILEKLERALKYQQAWKEQSAKIT